MGADRPNAACDSEPLVGLEQHIETAKISDLLEQWLGDESPRTLGDLINRFGEKSFALVFIVLMAVPALPLPTGGVTHVFEAVAMLVTLQLLVGRRSIWLPKRWMRIDLRSRAGERLTNALVKRVRWLERFSRPRLTSLTRGPATRSVFGLVVLVLSLSAFLAPPFSGLDTLPALGVVVVSVGVLLADFLLVALGTVIGAAGVVAVVGLGALVARWLGDLF